MWEGAGWQGLVYVYHILYFLHPKLFIIKILESQSIFMFDQIYRKNTMSIL